MPPFVEARPITKYHQADWSLFEACPAGHAGQAVLTDSSWTDCVRMLGELPQVPQSIDEFQQYLYTGGAVALTPSYHGRLVAGCPILQNITFAAASEGSNLARRMDGLVSDYESAAGIHAPYLSPVILNDQAVCLLAFEVVTCLRQRLQKQCPAFLQFASHP